MEFQPTHFEENLTCPVCRDIFRDPVLLLCSHSFCLVCLEQYWEHNDSQICPVCRTHFCMEKPPYNLALKNLCEIFLQERNEKASVELFCSLHGEKLELFCLEDKHLACRMCVNMDMHINHTCRLLDEAAGSLKEVLKTNMKPLKEKLKVLKNEKVICNQRAKHIKNQAQQTEACIKEEFNQLHQFLRDEETARIRATEEEIQSNNISFLLNYKDQLEITQCTCPEGPDKLPEVLIDVAKHLGNLKFNVWQKMRVFTHHTPVILDPNTAHPCLQLSNNLTDVRFGQWSQQALGYLEKCAGYTSVLGSEGFNTGTHYWDVEVGDNTTWALGVISESAIKARDNPPISGLWRLGYHNGKYGQGLSGDVLRPLDVKQKVQRIRVYLDLDRGELSFLNSHTNTHLHTFKHTFTEKVFPYFCNVCPSQALSILPVQTSITGMEIV
ncbi:zinc-binding protein A33-like isoform X2 [Myxocyprinus asiaticus]|uniref:zinc-binding protein A33-like isoform X2 n=1 Tax=Myxocyprinus asiaticus TaxID=70543 RepID=UPI00222227E7|nr:zinc-binding protein A33-like isoform X2 [Myxocyprinus asiaticus]